MRDSLMVLILGIFVQFFFFFWLIVIVCLPSTDEIIGQVVKNMKANGVAYTAIYTGLRPSRVRTMQEVLFKKKRKEK